MTTAGAVACVFHRQREAIGLCRDCRLPICPACALPDDDVVLCPDCFADAPGDGALGGPLLRVAGWVGLGLGLAAQVHGLWLLPALALATIALAGGLVGHLCLPAGRSPGAEVATWLLGAAGLVAGAVRIHFFGVGLDGGFGR